MLTLPVVLSPPCGDRWPAWSGSGRTDELGELVQAVVRAELGTPWTGLRQFVDRRITELSVEIHGTTQLLDFSEANLSGQLARIQQEIGRVIAVPAIATRTSGLELEAVVQATEQAANQIMEAAEAIGTWIEQAREDPAAIEAITERLNTIFEALHVPGPHRPAYPPGDRSPAAG